MRSEGYCSLSVTLHLLLFVMLFAYHSNLYASLLVKKANAIPTSQEPVAESSETPSLYTYAPVGELRSILFIPNGFIFSTFLSPPTDRKELFKL